MKLIDIEKTKINWNIDRRTGRYSLKKNYSNPEISKLSFSLIIMRKRCQKVLVSTNRLILF